MCEDKHRHDCAMSLGQPHAHTCMARGHARPRSVPRRRVSSLGGRSRRAVPASNVKANPIFVVRCCFISVSAWWHVVEENNPCAKPPKPDNQPGTSTTWLGLGAWDRGLGKQHGLGVHQCITVCEFEGEVVSACDPGGSVTWIAHDVFYRRLGAGAGPRSSIQAVSWQLVGFNERGCVEF